MPHHHDHTHHHHGHSHDYTHGHASINYNHAFAIGTALNLLFVVIEAGYGLVADSLALLADAGHNLSDIFSLLLAWGAYFLAARPATKTRTYGFRKATVLASLASAVLLLVTLGAIGWEAMQRLFNPNPVDGHVVMIVATIGVVINTLTALLFLSGQKHDLNLRGAFLHMAADAAVSLAVVAAGLLMLDGRWLWIDPLLTLIIVLVILAGTWQLLRESLHYALDAVPARIDLDEVEHYLASLPEVSQLHDLHIWPLSTTETALTVHLVVDAAEQSPLLQTIQHDLQDRFEIAHATIQLESEAHQPLCRLNRQNCH